MKFLKQFFFFLISLSRHINKSLTYQSIKLKTEKLKDLNTEPILNRIQIGS